MSQASTGAASFGDLVELSSARVGGKALACSDEFFAPKENLLEPGRGIFIPDKYTEFGKWMDGWESRRKRVPGYDWCILKLGIPGVVMGVDIDTNHFLGNYPPFASLEALEDDSDPSVATLTGKKAKWVGILPQAPLRGSSQNLFAIAAGRRFTHLRLNIYPDGGVARLKVYGRAAPDWSRFKKGAPIDLAAVENGGTVAGCSDMFFGNKDNMLMPGRSKDMGDGWETRRRRGPGSDWCVVALGAPGRLVKLEVDTNHFKGNHPDTLMIEGIDLRGDALLFYAGREYAWTEVLPRTKMKPHFRHFLDAELAARGPFTHLRLTSFPDGGVSRFRAWCTREA